MEGHEVWDVIQRSTTQMHIAYSGVVLGFNLATMLQIVDGLGYCRKSFLSLINAAESGMLQGIREIDNGDT